MFVLNVSSLIQAENPSPGAHTSGTSVANNLQLGIQSRNFQIPYLGTTAAVQIFQMGTIYTRELAIGDIEMTYIDLVVVVT